MMFNVAVILRVGPTSHPLNLKVRWLGTKRTKRPADHMMELSIAFICSQIHYLTVPSYFGLLKLPDLCSSIRRVIMHHKTQKVPVYWSTSRLSTTTHCSYKIVSALLFSTRGSAFLLKSSLSVSSSASAKGLDFHSEPYGC